jgi:hypothetical protein
MGVLFIILALVVIVGLITGIIMMCEDYYRTKGFFIMAGVALAIIGCVNIVATEERRLSKSSNITITVFYDKVMETAEHSLKLNDKNEFINDYQGKYISKKYPLDFSKIKTGDIIKYQCINGNFTTYIIKVEVVAKEGEK